MDIRAELLTDIEAFLAERNMSPTAFGREIMGDPRFVFDLRKTKRSPQLRTVDFVRRTIKVLNEEADRKMKEARASHEECA